MEPNANNVKALLISVHYGAPQPTLELLGCLARMDYLSELHVLIVNNEATACSGAELREAIIALPNAELFEPTRNLGYFGAASAALDYFLECNKVLPEWVIVCNNDVLIEDQDFFSRVFDHDPSVGIVAPRIQALPGRLDQNPFMLNRPGWLRWTSLRLIYSVYGMMAFWHWLSRQKKILRLAIAAGGDKSSDSNAGKRSPIFRGWRVPG
jgi:GT2 family glycosyltransferase